MAEGRELKTQQDIEAWARSQAKAREAQASSIGGMCDAAGISPSALPDDSSRAGAAIAAIKKAVALRRAAEQGYGR